MSVLGQEALRSIRRGGILNDGGCEFGAASVFYEQCYTWDIGSETASTPHI